jgi:7-cyano-7-deazaguanine reductase|tara:strand:+ start:105 stop:1022 length:918 start_codon:yes stop_codon:yes gene_type:complete
MALQELDNSSISKHLGQTSQYKATYDPELLVPEPRQSNRTHLGIQDDDLPFEGGDTWNAYEVSGLTHKGLPVAGVGKIYIPCNSLYIVESKSLKLYFNSFNMSKLGDTSEEVREEIQRRAQVDLSKLLGVNVEVKIFSNKEMLSDPTTPIEEWDHSRYITIEDDYPVEDMEFDTYQETPELIKVVKNEVGTVRYHSALLKSNCRVTSQPDWGDVYITLEGEYAPDPVSLLEYLVSFRDECHFHEEICEALYKRLLDICKPDELVVRCLYARRGGIDINPERYMPGSKKHHTLDDVTMPFIKTPKQ